ncbi:hypothetical protein [Rufibacter ruber]|uniref:hypothetical protein n=1 Tax=Rufibacter ruber TaxID=1783499 RepID=UPI000831CEFD|nr:hypothetical protein [Rufibacter ruber]
MNIRDAIQQIAQNTDRVYSSHAEVTSVDEYAMTCDVKFHGSELELFDVILPATDGGSPLVVPKVGSDVIIAFLSKNTAYVASVTVAEYFNIKNENESLKMILSDFLDAITQLTVPTPTGPSGVPVNAAAFTQIKTRLEKIFKS